MSASYRDVGSPSRDSEEDTAIHRVVTREIRDHRTARKEARSAAAERHDPNSCWPGIALEPPGESTEKTEQLERGDDRKSHGERVGGATRRSPRVAHQHRRRHRDNHGGQILHS